MTTSLPLQGSDTQLSTQMCVSKCGFLPLSDSGPTCGFWLSDAGKSRLAAKNCDGTVGGKFEFSSFEKKQVKSFQFSSAKQ
jgi:hypothetical protein